MGDDLDEIEHVTKTYGIKEYHIEDDNFTLKKAYVMEFCREIMARKLKFCPLLIELVMPVEQTRGLAGGGGGGGEAGGKGGKPMNPV